jgi:hypothetical protein
VLRRLLKRDCSVTSAHHALPLCLIMCGQKILRQHLVKWKRIWRKLNIRRHCEIRRWYGRWTVNLIVCLKEVLRVRAISVAHKPAVTESFEREVKYFQHPVVPVEVPVLALSHHLSLCALRRSCQWRLIGHNSCDVFIYTSWHGMHFQKLCVNVNSITFCS